MKHDDIALAELTTSPHPQTEFAFSDAMLGGGGSGGTEKWIWVLDPLTRKLRVPMSCLVPSAATSTPGSVPSLCIAFVEGRCRHPWCRQAHVLPGAIPRLRHEALNAPTCCTLHNDPHDTSCLSARFRTLSIVDGAPVAGDKPTVVATVPSERVALTVGLQRYLAHSVPHSQMGPNLDIAVKLICRLHLSHKCRYLEDCNNIHICRELEINLPPPHHVQHTLQTITPSTRTVTVADTLYTVHTLAVGLVSDEEFNAIIAPHIKTSETPTTPSTPFSTTPAWAANARGPKISHSLGNSLTEFPDNSLGSAMPPPPPPPSASGTPMLGFSLPPPNSPPPGYNQQPAFTIDAFCNNLSTLAGGLTTPPSASAAAPPPYDTSAATSSKIKPLKVSPQKIMDLRSHVPCHASGSFGSEAHVSSPPAHQRPWAPHTSNGKHQPSVENAEENGASSERDETL